MALAGMVGSACREALPPDVRLLGASAIRDLGGVRSSLFDGVARPRLSVGGAGKVVVRASGREVTPVDERVVEGRLLLTLPRPKGEGPLTLEVARDGGVWRRTIELRPDPFEAPAVLAVAEASDYTSAKAHLTGLDDDLWPWGCVVWARRVPAEARANAYLECASGAETRGFVSEAASRRIAALYWANRTRHLKLAQDILQEAEPAVATAGEPRLKAELDYQRGAYLRLLGHLREAQQALEAAAGLAVRIGEDGAATVYMMQAALTLSDMGWHDAALEQVEALAASSTAGLSAGDAATLDGSAGWIHLRAAQARGTNELLTPARRELERAAARYSLLGQPEREANALANLALLERLAGRPIEALALVSRARSASPTTRGLETAFLDLLEGEVHLEARRWAEAETNLSKAWQDSMQEDPGTATELLFRAQVGLAVAALAQHRRAEALARLARARHVLARSARLAGSEKERARLLEARRGVYSAAVTAFADAGELEAAWRLADQAQALFLRSLESDRRIRLARLAPAARARFEAAELVYLDRRERHLSATPPELASLDARDTWWAQRGEEAAALTAAQDELADLLDALDPTPPVTELNPSSLRRDEALLEVVTMNGRERGLRAFWVRRHGVVGRASDPRAFLDVRHLRGVRHLYVVDGAGAQSPPIASHLIEGVPAAARVNLTYIPYAAWLARPRPASSGPPLVVADPGLELPHARREGAWVAARLGVEVSDGPRATLSEVLEHLDGRRVFHFAGHGRLTPTAPWDAHLELASGQRLDVAAILMRRARLGLVVLDGCDTGRPHRAPVDGLGLAEAFLLAGASTVLATTAPVGDADAARFVRRFYSHGGAQDPAAAFRAAVKEAADEGDDAWLAFRLFGYQSS